VAQKHEDAVAACDAFHEIGDPIAVEHYVLITDNADTLRFGLFAKSVDHGFALTTFFGLITPSVRNKIGLYLYRLSHCVA
jgi:hypothetical protein